MKYYEREGYFGIPFCEDCEHYCALKNQKGEMVNELCTYDKVPMGVHWHDRALTGCFKPKVERQIEEDE